MRRSLRRRSYRRRFAEHLETIPSLPGLGTVYTPSGGAKYPFGKTGALATSPFATPIQAGLTFDTRTTREFFHQLRDAMWILRGTSARVVGIELGSFDTHNQQGSTAGPLATLLEALGYGLNSVDLETQNDPAIADLTTLVVSEFGRTSQVNASEGTDHGGATCVWAMGQRVQNALQTLPSSVLIGVSGTPTPWPGMFSANDTFFGCTPNPTGTGTYVDMRSDFRAVFGEAIRKIFSPSASQMDYIIPNYTGTFLANGLERNDLA